MSMSGNSQRIWGTLDPFYESGPVLGRKVANERFLNALLTANPFDAYHFFIRGGDVRKSLRRLLHAAHPELDDRITVFPRRELPRRLAKTDYHCFHQSDCITTQPELTVLRNELSRKIFPITGTIHSLSYHHFGRDFLRHLSPTTTPRDAIVCTSTPGRAALEAIFDRLRMGYGLDRKRFPAPAMPCVPLGVDTHRFPARQKGKESHDTPCRFLVFGRMSHYSKMDLIPLLRAFQRLFSQGLPTEAVELTLAGWTEDGDDFLPTLKELARNIGLPLVVKERPEEPEKLALFARADVFVSIADNPQETFGITVLEAGAAGLPSIVSDYDGYRDIVVEEETGLRIPVVGPSRTPQANRMAPLSFDSAYHLTLAQQTAVSIPAMAEALHRMITDPAARRTMGRNARKRMEGQYDWPVIIRRYVALWDSLWEKPVEAPSTDHPSRMDYGTVFNGYPTRCLCDELVVTTGRTGSAVYRGADHVLPYAGLEAVIDPEHARLAAFFARKPITCGELAERLMEATGMNRETADYLILWALKHDILEH